MKKILCLLFLILLCMLSDSKIYAADTISIGQTQFNRVKTSQKAPEPYTHINDYFGNGLEQNKFPDKIRLFYSPYASKMTDVSEFFINGFSDLTTGMKKCEDNKFAISYIDKLNLQYFYSIVKVEHNKIAGMNSSQIYIHIPSPKNQKDAIKQYDNKYFNLFYNAKIPSVKDEYGKTVPKTYKLAIGDKNTILKYSSTKNGYGQNYYLLRKENLKKHNFIVRINYTNFSLKSDKMVNDIIKSRDYYNLFKIHTNKKIKNIHLFSHSALAAGSQGNYIQYSILKIDSSQKQIKTMEIVEYFPYKEGENYDANINALEQKYSQYLIDNPMPKFVNENFGTLPESLENDKMFVYQGLPR